MQLHLFRLVLNEVQDLFAMLNRSSREDWLRTVFNEPFTFTHRSKPYYYVPTHFPLEDQSEFILGRVGRSKAVKDHEPPSANFETVIRDSWDVAHIVLDPRHHDDGQKIGFEANTVGEPIAILRSMLKAINARPTAPYFLSVNPIAPLASFLEFLNRHPEDITYIKFDLNAPNMFGHRTDVDGEMQVARDVFRAKRAQIILANDEGMTLDHQRIREMGDYATSGGGEVKAKTIANETFSTQKEVEQVQVSIPEDIDDRKLLWLLANALARK